MIDKDRNNFCEYVQWYRVKFQKIPIFTPFYGNRNKN
jgi:hypothetical protein